MTNRQLFLSHLAQTSTSPLALEIEYAKGVYMYGADNKKYIDLIAGIGVSALGHSHPAVVAAVKEQVEKYMHLMVYGEFVQSPQVKFAERLLALLPERLNNIYFTNSGAEATEGAMKLAKRLTGRTEFISFANSYHGSTQGALSIMGDEYFKRKFRPLLPGVTLLTYNREEDLNKITTNTAAVIIEPVQAESGVVVPTQNFMKALQKKCSETGAILIFDEAQTGFGRTGKMFAYEHTGITPDILLLAKALGGGMPLGAFISSKKNMASLCNDPVLGHITTFGGHPVCCAAGLAALDVLQQQNLLQTVEAKGKLFEELLSNYNTQTIARSGLLMALPFASYEQNKKVIDRCIEKGVLTDWFLFAPNCLRIAPPLIITEQEIQTACVIIGEAINEVIK